jgi:hypothetical protein
MINKRWFIDNMRNISATGGVFEVTWYCSVTRSKRDAQDQEHTYEMMDHGVAEFTPVPDDHSFTSLSDLTEEQVLGWVWQSINKTAIEQRLEQDIQTTYFDDTIDSTIPWVESQE